MAVDSIRKELCGILERLDTLSAPEKNSLLVFLSCLLPSSASDTKTSNQLLNGIYRNTEDFASLIPLSLPDSTRLESVKLGDSQSLVKTSDKSVNVPEDDAPTDNSVRGSFDRPETNESSESSNRKRLPNCAPSLYCPICCEKFHTWPKMEEHLYGAHVTTVAPVCWRCQGVFSNHSLLLAHECFDWGRLNLPCQVVLDGSSVAASRRRSILQNSKHLGYPPNGVFLQRRCGLCFKSDTLFTDYHSFRRHKDSEHPAKPVGSKTVCQRRFEGQDLDSDEEVSHPQSVENLRSMLQRLLTHFKSQATRGLVKSTVNRRRCNSTIPRKVPATAVPQNLDSNAPVFTQTVGSLMQVLC